MLKSLTVSNLAVVERAEAEFAPGLNVLTGETGAGKSVLMGALGLVLGGRADSSVVRDGAKEARVEAAFDVSRLADRVSAVLDEVGLPACEDGELIVRRTVGADGKGRVWVNDGATTVATLKRLGVLLVDIHGPRANQRILEERFQRETLDAYGETGAALSAYRERHAALSGIEARIAELSADSAGNPAEELEMLRYQVGELEEAALSEDDETIAERHAAAAHAGEIVEGANAITEALGGDGGAAERLIALQPRFAALSRHFPEAAAWGEQADEITLRIQELSRSVADAASRIDLGEEDLDELDARLTVVNRLKRKYRVNDVSGLLSLLEAKRARLDGLEHRDERIAELKADAAKAEAALRTAGVALGKRRRAAAAKLAKAVTAGLHDLGFLQAKFGVELEPIDPEPHGMDRVTYVFEPNPGESARPLADIASSGEAARVMLALKGVLAEHDEVDVLVFDEIDANIGGETGRAVGERMRAVAAHHQVIAITHLPQSAAYGDRHLVVSKAVSGGRTRTMISEVEGEARVLELARMLGGEKSTTVVKRHAEELLGLSR